MDEVNAETFPSFFSFAPASLHGSIFPAFTINQAISAQLAREAKILAFASNDRGPCVRMIRPTVGKSESLR